MSGNRIAILTAMKEERGTILSRARDVKSGPGASVFARIGACDVVLAPPRDGSKESERTAIEICEAARPSALIGAGVAGGLSAGLSPGDLLVSREIRDSAGLSPLPDAGLLSRALRGGQARAAVFVTVELPLVTASQKASLAASLGKVGPAAADMESAGWARAAASRGIPYLVVRSISDGPDEELPDYLPRCIGGDGRIRRSAIVARALSRPGTIPALLRMRRRVSRCSAELALFLEHFLKEAL